MDKHVEEAIKSVKVQIRKAQLCGDRETVKDICLALVGIMKEVFDMEDVDK